MEDYLKFPKTCRFQHTIQVILPLPTGICPITMSIAYMKIRKASCGWVLKEGVSINWTLEVELQPDIL
jgi:hypothetical protein